MAKIHWTSIKEGRQLAKQEPPCECDQCLDEARSAGRFVYCTRENGHEGRHMAHIPGPSVVATWERQE